MCGNFQCGSPVQPVSESRGGGYPERYRGGGAAGRKFLCQILDLKRNALPDNSLFLFLHTLYVILYWYFCICYNLSEKQYFILSVTCSFEVKLVLKKTVFLPDSIWFAIKHKNCKRRLYKYWCFFFFSQRFFFFKYLNRLYVF